MIELNSVGSYITRQLKVFPIDITEAPETAAEAEEMLGVHIYDLDSEWFNSLSSDDLVSFFEFVESTQDLVGDVFYDWKIKIWGEWEDVNNCYMNLETI